MDRPETSKEWRLWREHFIELLKTNDHVEIIHEYDLLVENIHSLEAERDRLREALEQIKNEKISDGEYYICRDFQKIAKEALKGEEG